MAHNLFYLELDETCKNEFEINEEFTYKLVMAMSEKGLPFGMIIL